MGLSIAASESQKRLPKHPRGWVVRQRDSRERDAWPVRALRPGASERVTLDGHSCLSRGRLYLGNLSGCLSSSWVPFRHFFPCAQPPRGASCPSALLRGGPLPAPVRGRTRTRKNGPVR